MIKEYGEYLKDNPEGYWFKRKLYGWGWVPAKRQGWLIIGLFLIYIGWTAKGFAKHAEAQAVADGEVTSFMLRIALGLAVLLAVCYYKGEKPRWQWGAKQELPK